MKTDLARYPTYQTSRIGWAETIPVRWETGWLGECSRSIQTGPFGSQLHAADYVSEGTPVINPSNIVGGKVVPDWENAVNESKARALRRHRFHKGDIVFGRRGEMGRCATIGDTEDGWLCGTGCLLVRLKEHRLMPDFAALLLSQAGVRDALTLESVGATMDNLNTRILAKMRIPVPPIEDQCDILAFIERETAKIDRLMGVRQEQVERLQEQRTTVIHHAVTKGLDPHAKMNPSGVEWLGNIPADWRLIRLGVVASVKARLGWKGLTASEYVESGNIFLSTPDIKGPEIDFDNSRFITDERYFESPEIMLQVGDVLLVKDGATLGIVNVVRYLPSGATVNGSIAVIRIKKLLSPAFLYYFLKSQYFQNVIQEVKGGMGVPHLFQSDIVKFKVLIPGPDDQVEIVDYLDHETAKIDTVISNYQRELELLEEYRASLISHAVTGQIDVRGLLAHAHPALA